MTPAPADTPPSRLSPGDVAPDVRLLDADEQPVDLAAYRGRKVVLYFYPAASTPGCTKQACDFRDNLKLLQDSGYAVLGISPDKPVKLRKFRDEEELTFPLLSDPERSVLTAYAAYGPKLLYGRQTVGVIRSTFVVDEGGRIAAAYYNVKATGHVAKLLRELHLSG